MDTFTFITNPAAGRGRARRVAQAAADRLRAHGKSVQVLASDAPGHATELATAAVAGGQEAVVVCGGDGTISHVLAPLAHSQTALGLLPVGTGNDLARALHIPRSTPAATRLLLNGTPRAIDLGRCDEGLFATIAAFGFDAEVSQLMQSGQIPVPGTAGYLLATARHLRSYRPHSVRLQLDDRVIEQSVFLVAVSNTSSYGGGLRMAPDADPYDGRFDVVIVDGDLSRSAAAWLLPRLFWGAHVRHPAVRVDRCRQIHLTPIGPTVQTPMLYADGEPLAALPSILSVEKAAVRVIQGTDRLTKAS